MENSRGAIEGCPNLRFQSSVVGDSGVPKIREDKPVRDIGRYGTENILWFNVSMRNALFVDVVNSSEDLAYDPTNL